jgi:formylglycine-generating enzyme required for sulfatase activity/protocatechuate 3,4-dioxygenase beta subunit
LVSLLVLPGAGLALEQNSTAKSASNKESRDRDDEAPANEKQAANSVTYTGRVVDKETGNPIEGASIKFGQRRQDGTAAKAEITEHRTNARGEFSFTLPVKQESEYLNYHLWAEVEHPQYLRRTTSVHEGLAGQPFFHQIDMYRSTDVTGVVETPDGEPSQRTRVVVYSCPNPDDRWQKFGSWSDTRTDEGGKFSLAAASNGTVILWLLPREFAPQSRELGGKRGDLGRLKLERGLRLTGQVLDAAGQPVNGVRVTATLKDGLLFKNELPSSAEQISRGASTYREGQFRFERLPAGEYRLSVDTTAWRERNPESTPPLFATTIVALNDDYQRAEIRAVSHATIEAHVADSSGKPVSGQRIVLSGRSAGEVYGTFADSDARGTILLVAPRGIRQTSLSLLNTDSETIARFGPSDRAHLRLNGRLEGIELYEDLKGIVVTRYRCPTLLVKAMDQNGKAIDRFTPELTYSTTAANAVGSIRGHRGDVYFAKLSDGLWRSEQLIPDKDFTIAATAPGYQVAFEKLTLREAESKELTLTLPPVESDGRASGAKDTSEKGRAAAAFTNSVGVKLALIPAGEFVMGSPKDEEGRAPPWGSIDGVAEMQHEVRITRPFYMSVYEVTQEEYQAVMGENPSRHSPEGSQNSWVRNLDTKRFPAENMTWFEANDFCKRLSTSERKTYRLPTEAEWEYACRAGTTTAFHFGDTFDGTQANMHHTYPRGTPGQEHGRGWPTNVGSYPPNAFGLYDMHGNVREWCSDLSASGYYAMSPRDDPQGVSITSFNPRTVKEETWARTIRGGGLTGAHYSRSASRSSWHPNHPRDFKGTWDIGIRLVCEVPQARKD